MKIYTRSGDAGFTKLYINHERLESFSKADGIFDILGKIDELNFDKPLEIKAYQYDIVCNGVELSSGAIRNHIPELMYKLFSVAGYSESQVNDKFSGMINAFSYGAPPHGGIAPGIDRIVMLLAEKENIREVTLFPMNQNAQDLMMNAPSEIDETQLKELGLSLKFKK
jgi:aspartyl-tRNA synthetase